MDAKGWVSWLFAKPNVNISSKPTSPEEEMTCDETPEAVSAEEGEVGEPLPTLGDPVLFPVAAAPDSPDGVFFTCPYDKEGKPFIDEYCALNGLRYTVLKALPDRRCMIAVTGGKEGLDKLVHQAHVSASVREE